jgi:hypothetical protein
MQARFGQTTGRQAARQEQANRQKAGTQAEVRQKDKCQAERAGGKANRQEADIQTIGR